MDITIELLCHNDKKWRSLMIKANRASIVKGGAGRMENVLQLQMIAGCK